MPLPHRLQRSSKGWKTYLMSENELYELYAAALDAMRTVGPGPLAARVDFEAKMRSVEHLAPVEVLIDHVAKAQIGDRILSRLRLTLATWDADTTSSWGEGTDPRTEPRRERIYALLDLTEEMRACSTKRCPLPSTRPWLSAKRLSPGLVA